MIDLNLLTPCFDPALTDHLDWSLTLHQPVQATQALLIQHCILMLAGCFKLWFQKMDVHHACHHLQVITATGIGLLNSRLVHEDEALARICRVSATSGGSGKYLVHLRAQLVPRSCKY